MWEVWLIIAGLLAIGEILTPGFILLWFAIAGLITAFLALAGVNLYVQLVVFILSSTLMLIYTRPILKKFLKQKEVPSNVFSLIGKRGIVVQGINNLEGLGQVKIGGEIWKAVSEDGREIEVDTEIEVIRVEGVKVIVKPIEMSKVK